MSLFEKYYEIWEGDHYVFVSKHDTLEEARAECDRLNREANRDYFIKIHPLKEEYA